MVRLLVALGLPMTLLGFCSMLPDGGGPWSGPVTSTGAAMIVMAAGTLLLRRWRPTLSDWRSAVAGALLFLAGLFTATLGGWYAVLGVVVLLYGLSLVVRNVYPWIQERRHREDGDKVVLEGEAWADTLPPGHDAAGPAQEKAK
jgi:hypothetical protein